MTNTAKDSDTEYTESQYPKCDSQTAIWHRKSVFYVVCYSQPGRSI
jgi:hypothetical protein